MADPTGKVSLSRIGQIALTVHDVERAITFYRDVLELTFLFQAGSLAFFDCGGVRLMLSDPEKPEYDHPSSILYYAVDDVESTHATLLQRGVTFQAGPMVVHKTDQMELWMAFFHDPDGNPAALMCEKAI